MKKDWKKPMIIVFNDSSINSAAGNPLMTLWEAVQYCDNGVVKTGTGVGSIGGFPFRTVNSPNAMGRVGGGLGITAATPDVSGGCA